MIRQKTTHLITFLRNIRLGTFIDAVKYSKFIIDIALLNCFNNSGNKSIQYDDVFILSSCINQRDANFFNFNNKQTEFERFSEVCTSVESVRSVYPMSKIVYLDNSKLNPDYEEYLKKIVDDYQNYSDHGLMVQARGIKNKGIPWSLTNLLYLLGDNKFLNAKNVHLMNGRYLITEKTLMNALNSTADNYLYIKFKNLNVSVIYLLFRNVANKVIAFEFKIACIMSVTGFSVEDVFGLFRLKTKYIQKLGLHGKINGEQQNAE